MAGVPTPNVRQSAPLSQAGHLGGQHAGSHSDNGANIAKKPTDGKWGQRSAMKQKGLTDMQRSAEADKMFEQEMNAGKIKNLNATQEAIAKKTGAWPNGYTN